MSGEEPKRKTTTISEYDRTQLKAAFKSVLMGVGMMAVMHLYFKYTNPLLIQSLSTGSVHVKNRLTSMSGILPLKGAIEGKLVQIHVFGKPAIGELKRPWKASAGLMAGLTGETQNDEDKTTQGAVGAKEE
jgi:Phosphate transport (Pho88)